MAVAIHWFRKGLRLHDNPALLEACRRASVVVPVFVIDPWFVSEDRVGVNRMRFLLESLECLDAELRKRDSQLYVLKGRPEVVLCKAIKHFHASVLTFEEDFEPYARSRDKTIKDMATAFGVETVVASSHTLYHPAGVEAASKGGKPPLTYGQFVRLLSAVGDPPAPCEDVPDSIPGAGLVACPPPELCFAGGRGAAAAASLSSSSSSSASSTAPVAESRAASDVSAPVPTLAELGYTPPAHDPLFPGGEIEAIRRMEAKMSDAAWVRGFSKPSTTPTSVGEPSTTGLSPYLKFGCLSPRRFWMELHAVLRGGSHTKPPTSLVGQLLWREFYISHGYSYPNYDRMVGNPVCRQIAWDKDDTLLDAWKTARTGYPWIDACMRQLQAQGYLHHLGRHAVACFLTRGDLYQSWEEGARHFDRLLVDSDWALNSGNWMWLSASAYFYQYFRVYSPVAFPKKTDPNGDYVRRWVPELARYPKQFIYEPWKAPKAKQREWGCVIGIDYPDRVVDHQEASKRNMGRHKAAYDAHKGQAPPLHIDPRVSGAGALQVGSAPPPPKPDGGASSKRPRPQAAKTAKRDKLASE